MEGTGKWFETKQAAQSYVARHFERGARSFDVGCFQINYKWHHQGFESVNQMFEPVENALYAARFLAKLYSETGSWSKAAGVYHSRTPKFATRYSKRFDRILAALDPEFSVAMPDRTTLKEPDGDGPRQNSYPFLKGAGTSRGLGSLVPLGDANRPLLFVLTRQIEKLQQ